MPSFDELLAELLEESEEVLGVLADIVNKGRMQADYLEPDYRASSLQAEPGALVRAPRLRDASDGAGRRPDIPAGFVIQAYD